MVLSPTAFPRRYPSGIEDMQVAVKPASKPTSTIRIATPHDEEPLLDILRQKHEEDGMGSFDVDLVRATVRRGIRQDWAMIGVIRGDHIIEATIGLFIGALWCSTDQHLSDLWHYVSPTYRRSTHGKALLEFAKWASGELERPLVMATIKNAATEKKVALYERQFGQPVGFVFRYTKDGGIVAA